MATVGLLPQPEGPLLDREVVERLPRPQLVPLALAPVSLPARAEDRLEVVPARLVGGHDRDRAFRRRHAARFSTTPAMTPDQRPPIDALDTAELELPPPAEPSADELEPGRPSWEPDDGDFS
jgi:hypothetical protein